MESSFFSSSRKPVALAGWRLFVRKRIFLVASADVPFSSCVADLFFRLWLCGTRLSLSTSCWQFVSNSISTSFSSSSSPLALFWSSLCLFVSSRFILLLLVWQSSTLHSVFFWKKKYMYLKKKAIKHQKNYFSNEIKSKKSNKY